VAATFIKVINDLWFMAQVAHTAINLNLLSNLSSLWCVDIDTRYL